MARRYATVRTIRDRWNDCTWDVRDNNCTMLEYIEQTAARMNLRITRWNILKMFADENDNIVMDKRQINKVFFDAIENPPEVEPIEVADQIKTAIRTSVSSVIFDRKNNLTMNIEDCKHDARTHYQRYSNAMQRVREFVVELENLSDVCEESVDDQIRQLEEVISDGQWEKPLIKDNCLWLVTTNECAQQEINSAANLNVHVNAGKFAIRINLGSYDLNIVPVSGNRICRGYFHPHLSGWGEVCWGDALDTISDYQSAGRIADILRLTHQLLNAYNPGNPYVALSVFKNQGRQMTATDYADLRVTAPQEYRS